MWSSLLGSMIENGSEVKDHHLDWDLKFVDDYYSKPS